MRNVYSQISFSLSSAWFKLSKVFYGDILGCDIGRSSDEWIDFNFYGHQIVAHLDPKKNLKSENSVDGEKFPTFHFGLILVLGDWEKLVNELIEKKYRFL